MSKGKLIFFSVLFSPVIIVGIICTALAIAYRQGAFFLLDFLKVDDK